MKTTRNLALVLCLLSACHAAPSSAYRVGSLTAEQAAEHELDPAFYKKATEVQGILIATSDRVCDHAHLETAYLFDKMMRALRPDIARRIRERRVLCILLAHDELTSQVPQFKTDKTGKELDFYNWRQRGFLAWPGGRPVVLFAEEDVLEYEGGMQLESILIHEFGHVVHGVGFDEALEKRWTETYEAAKAAGLWNDGRAAQRFRRVKSDTPVLLYDALRKWFPEESPELIARCLDGGDILINGKPTTRDVKVTGQDQVLIVFGGPKRCYAAKNRAEYFAEGFQTWFDTNRTMDHDHNHIHTREQLRDYDKPLAALCAEVMGDPDWRFVSPRRRAGRGHLRGYDPDKAPEVKLLPHIETAMYDYYDKYWHAYWDRLYEKHGLERPAAAVRR